MPREHGFEATSAMYTQPARCLNSSNLSNGANKYDTQCCTLNGILKHGLLHGV